MRPYPTMLMASDREQPSYCNIQRLVDGMRATTKKNIPIELVRSVKLCVCSCDNTRLS